MNVAVSVYHIPCFSGGKPHLCDLDTINLEFCVRVGLFCVDDLFYCDRTQSIGAIGALSMVRIYVSTCEHEAANPSSSSLTSLL